MKLRVETNELIFKHLLLKLTTKSTFILNTKYYKLTEGCTVGGPLSVVFSDIDMTKLEKDAILPPRIYNQNCMNALLTTSLQDVKLMSQISY